MNKGLLLAKEASKMLYYFIESLKSSKFKGIKFKPVTDRAKQEFFELVRKALPPERWSEELKRPDA